MTNCKSMLRANIAAAAFVLCLMNASAHAGWVIVTKENGSSNAVFYDEKWGARGAFEPIPTKKIGHYIIAPKGETDMIFVNPQAKIHAV